MPGLGTKELSRKKGVLIDRTTPSGKPTLENLALIDTYVSDERL